MKKIKSWGAFLLKESEGNNVWIAWAGDSANYAMGVYATEQEAKSALDSRYHSEDGVPLSWLMSGEHPWVAEGNADDPKVAKDLFTKALGASETIDGKLEWDDATLFLVKKIVSLGVDIEHFIFLFDTFEELMRFPGIEFFTEYLGDLEELKARFRRKGIRKKLF